jgi:hypothetical protein
LPDGSYLVQVNSTGDQKVDERYELTHDMKTKSFQWSSDESGPDRGAERVTCEYQPHGIRCRKIFFGKSSTAELQQEPPYIPTQGDEWLVFDMAWAMQMEAVQAVRSPGQLTAITEISVGGDGGNIDLDATYQSYVKYLGLDTIQIGKRKVVAHKLQPDPPEKHDSNVIPDEHPQFVWLAQSGLLLKYENESVIIQLTNPKGPGCSKLFDP